MKISIAMATYNGAKFLREQLESFAGQTRPPDELVICDDGSTDDTVRIIEEFSRVCGFPVRLFKNEVNVGFVKNFERTISACTGDLIALSDQDDVWLNEKLEVVEQLFLANPDALVIINDLIICDGELNRTKYTKLGHLKALGLEESYFITGCCTTIKRVLLEVALPFPNQLEAHDTWINGVAELIGGRLVLRRPLQLYRRHESNTSDHITSSRRRLSKLSLIRKYGMRDAREGWRKEIQSKRDYIDRLEEYKGTIDSLGRSENASWSIKKLRKDVDAFLSRLEIVSIPRWRRAPAVIKNWLVGNYSAFAGWKSAMKDVVRP